MYENLPGKMAAYADRTNLVNNEEALAAIRILNNLLRKENTTLAEIVRRHFEELQLKKAKEARELKEALEAKLFQAWIQEWDSHSIRTQFAYIKECKNNKDLGMLKKIELNDIEEHFDNLGELLERQLKTLYEISKTNKFKLREFAIIQHMKDSAKKLEDPSVLEAVEKQLDEEEKLRSTSASSPLPF